MRHGPVDVIVVQFPAGVQHGSLVRSLAEVADKGLVRIVDIVFLSKNPDGTLVVGEVDAVDSELGGLYADLDGDFGGLLSEDDLEAAAADLAPGTAAGVLVMEHLWARGLAAGLASAGGEVVSTTRIPAAEVDAAFTELEPA